MPDGGVFGFGGPRRGVAPYLEREDPVDNAVDRWLDRQTGALLARLPFARWRLMRRVRRILALEPVCAAMTDTGLLAEAARLRTALRRDRGDIAAVTEAFALVREVSARVLDKRHYPVQMLGALALYDGRMIEMATGEGKTLTATPAAVVAALAGDPVHVVTVNDYLAARDADENRPIFDFLGLSVSVIDSDMDPGPRQAAYACDITYISNNNLAFDYLRDRIALGPRRGLARLRAQRLLAPQAGALLLRGLIFTIIDEADSVLVDEARTPLILSSTADDPEAARMYAEAHALAAPLVAGRDYELDTMNRQITLETRGKRIVAEAAADLGLTGLWKIRKAREELVTQALSARDLFERERDYIVAEDDTVQIVDEFTGRVLPDRSWQAGLHQMIEAKEGVGVTGRKVTLARITYQRFFRRYIRLAGMTGTGMELAGEFRDTYGLSLLRVPTHRPRQRRHLGDVYLPDTRARWARVADHVAARHARGQPVLIGTRSVEASEQAAAALTARGLDFALLNAKQDADEAAVIAGAGQRGAITVATNIAGRGTDIKLGDGVRALGGLHVILTEFHESLRIDRQLYGRAGRQGDPGSTEAIVSLDDDLFSRFAPWRLRVARRLPLPVICAWLRRGAQARAEAEHAATRRQQTALDKQLEKQLAFTGRME